MHFFCLLDDSETVRGQRIIGMQNPFADSCWGCDIEGFSRSFYRWQPEDSPSMVPSELGWQHLLSDYKNNTAKVVTEDSACLIHGRSESVSLFGHYGHYTEPHSPFTYAPCFGASKMVISSPFNKTEKANSDDNVKDDAVLFKADGLETNQIEVIGHSVDWTTWTWRQCVNCRSPAENIRHNAHEEAPLAATAGVINEPLHEYFGSNQVSDLSSEMQEDTEELDALLYSDDDDANSSEEGEVDSTGHSPCTLAICMKEQFEESVDEILSSARPSRNRKRKLLEDGHSGATSLIDTASSADICQCQSKAVSPYPVGEVCSANVFPESKKRMRRDATCEAGSILETILQGSTGKSTFLDDAIRHLESLKAEAHTLGFSSSSS